MARGASPTRRFTCPIDALRSCPGVGVARALCEDFVAVASTTSKNRPDVARVDGILAAQVGQGCGGQVSGPSGARACRAATSASSRRELTGQPRRQRLSGCCRWTRLCGGTVVARSALRPGPTDRPQGLCAYACIARKYTNSATYLRYLREARIQLADLDVGSAGTYVVG